jgi:hypothetical protein
MKKIFFLLAGVLLCQEVLSQQCGLSFFDFNDLDHDGSGHVKIRFITNTENSDLDRFEIYRSRDNAATFQIAGVIPATKSGNVTYDYTDLGADDPIPPAPTVYYRIIWYSITNEACTSNTRTIDGPITYSNPCNAAGFTVPDNNVCTGSSSPFIITNSPSNVSWSLSPNDPSIATLTTFGGTKVIVNQIGNGFVTLNASITGAGCSRNFSQNLMIGNALLVNNGITGYTINGSPRPLGSGNSNGIPGGTSAAIAISLNNPTAVGNVTWSVTSAGSPAITGFSQSGNGQNASFSINLPSMAWSNSCTLGYSASTDCGTTLGSVQFTVFKSGGFFTVMQSGSSEVITIQSQRNQNKREGAAPGLSKIYGVRIIDQNGIIRKNYNYSAGILNTTLYLNGLMAGVYVVSIFDGSNWTNRKIFLR